MFYREKAIFNVTHKSSKKYFLSCKEFDNEFSSEFKMSSTCIPERDLQTLNNNNGLLSALHGGIVEPVTRSTRPISMSIVPGHVPDWPVYFQWLVHHQSVITAPVNKIM